MCRDCQSRYLATAQPRRSERRFVLTADSLTGTVKEFSRAAASTSRTVGTRDRKAGSSCRTVPNADPAADTACHTEDAPDLTASLADGMAGNTRRTAGLPRHGSAATCPTAGSIGQAQKPRHRTGKSFYLTAELFYHAVFRQKHADIAKNRAFCGRFAWRPERSPTPPAPLP